MSYYVIRVRALVSNPTCWDLRTKTVVGVKNTLGEACDLACQVARLDGQERARFLIRRPGRKDLIGDGPRGRLRERQQARQAGE